MDNLGDQIQKIPVTEKLYGKRLDIAISEIFCDISRTYIKKLIVDGNILIDDQKQKPHYKLRAGEKITITFPPPEDTGLKPENIELDIIYEDQEILVLNKQPGIVVHPAPGHPEHTLVNALLHHIKDFSLIGGVRRPGIVHRLDKDTSGCLVVAKTERSCQYLQKQFKNRIVKKYYLALAGGIIPLENGTIDAPIGRHQAHRRKMSVNYTGRGAVTEFHVKERYSGATLLEILLKTGRTHQIRVHLSHIGHPVLGDREYGSKYSSYSVSLGVTRQLLHAWKIGFQHPEGHHWIEFAADMPDDMKYCIHELKRAAHNGTHFLKNTL
jgi:23S rRNA pseudouridine1911/1915/1917 synthase